MYSTVECEHLKKNPFSVKGCQPMNFKVNPLIQVCNMIYQKRERFEEENFQGLMKSMDGLAEMKKYKTAYRTRKFSLYHFQITV